MADDEYTFDASDAPASIAGSRAAIGNLDQNPEEAAKAIKIGKSLNAPPVVVDGDLKGWEAQDKTNQAARAIQTTPALANYAASDPMAAKVSSDDWTALASFVNNPLKSLANLLPNAPPGAMGSQELAQASGLTPEQLQLMESGGLGDVSLPEDVTYGYKLQDYLRKSGALGIGRLAGVSGISSDFLRDFEANVKEPAVAGDFLGRALQSFRQFAGETASAVVHGGAVGAAGGAGIGAVGGAPGAAVGALAGLAKGVAADFALSIYGSTYRRLDTATDQDGNSVSEFTKQAAALAAGTIGGALMMAAPGVSAGVSSVFGRLTGSVLGETATRLASSPIINNAFTQTATRVGQSALGGAAINAGLELTQTLSDQIAKSSQNFQTIFNDPKQREEWINGLVSAAENGAMLFGGLHLAGIGLGKVLDKAHVDAAKSAQDSMDATMAGREDSKTWQRAPEMFANAIEPVVGDVKAHVPSDIVAQNKEGFGFVGDLDEQLRLTGPTGGEVSMPVKDVIAHMDQDTYKEVRDHMRFGELSPAEAAELGDVEERAPFQPEMVKSAAIKAGDEVFEGITHTDAFLTAEAKLGELPKSAHTPEAQGYTTTMGRYVTRQEAMDIARNTEQLQLRKGVNRNKADLEATEFIKPILDNAEAAAKKLYWLDPLFRSPADVGLSTGDFQRYSNHIQEVQRKLTQGVFDAVSTLETKMQTKEWKDNRTEMLGKVTQEMRLQPAFMADRYLRTGENPDGAKTFHAKLDPSEASSMLTIEEMHLYDTALKMSEFLPKTMFAKEGMLPDELSDLFGFDSGKSMLDALAKLEQARKALSETPAVHFSRIARRVTDERMQAEHGNLGENIMRAAIDAALDVAQVDVLHDEVRGLAAKAGEAALTKDDFRSEIVDRFAQLKATDAAEVENYRRLIQKYGLAAERALLRGDFVTAFQAKQAQLMNFLLAREARQLQREAKKFSRVIKPFLKERVLDRVDQDYTNQIHGLLQKVGFQVPQNPTTLADELQKAPLDGFIRAKNDEGRMIVPPNLPQAGQAGAWGIGSMTPGPTYKQFANFTTDEFRDFKATIESLAHNGRDEKTIEVAGKKAIFNTIRAEAVGNLKNLPVKFDPYATGLSPFAKEVGRSIDAYLLKMERLFDWFDKNDPNGVFNRTVFRPLSEAKSWKDDELTRLGKMFEALPTTRAWTKGLKQGLPNTILKDADGVLIPMTREKMLAMALNSGSKSNHIVLTKGRGWDAQASDDFLYKNMTKKDLDYVQGVFDILKTIWPKIEEVTRRLSGVRPDKIEPRKIITAAGTIEGGYYPLIRDPQSLLEHETARSSDLFENIQFDPLPNPRSTKTRTGAVYPLRLDVDNLPQRIIETIHNLAFREPIINAQKILNDTSIRKAVTKAFGPEYVKQFTPWLKHIASNGGFMDETGLAWLVQQGRMNVQVMMIGFKPSTSIIHGVSAMGNSMTEVGGWNLARAQLDRMTRNVQNYASMTEEAYAQSGELRNRGHNLDRDINYMMATTLGKESWRKAFMGWSMGLIKLLDQATAIPTFMAARDMALREGKTLEDAVYAGDKAIRNAHGAAGITDLAAVQRGSPVEKLFTMFYAYFNHNYNQLRHMGREMSGGDFTGVLSRSLGYLIIPAAIHAAMRQDKDKNETWANYAARALSQQLGGTLPFVRDLAYSLTEGKAGDVGNIPIYDILKGVSAVSGDIRDFWKGHHVSDKWVQHVLDTPGYLAGFGTSTTSKAGQFLWDLKKGKQRLNPNEKTGTGKPGSFLRGLLTGKAK